MKRPDQPQPVSLTEAVIPIASLILLVGLSFYLFGDAGAGGPNQVALVMATMIAVFIGWRRGHSLDSLRDAAVKSGGTGIGAGESCSEGLLLVSRAVPRDSRREPTFINVTVSVPVSATPKFTPESPISALRKISRITPRAVAVSVGMSSV